MDTSHRSLLPFIVKKSEEFHIAEAHARVDMHGKKFDDALVYEYEYNYIKIFLECFCSCLFQGSTDNINFFDNIEWLGDQVDNHNQLLYFKDHIMPYLMDTAPEPMKESLRAMFDAITAAEKQTNLWWDDNGAAIANTKAFYKTIENSRSACTIPMDKIEKYVFYHFVKFFVHRDSIF